MEGVAVRGLLARRPSRPRQAHRPLRRQPHLARRVDVARASPRTSRRASPPYGWHVERVDDGNDLDAHRARDRNDRARDARPPLDHPRPHQDRLRRAAQAGYVRGARLAARARRAARRRRRTSAGRPSPRSGSRRRRWRTSARALERGKSRASASGTSASTRTPRRFPTLAAELKRRIAGELPAGWDAESARVPRRRERARDPQGVRGGDAGAGRATPGAGRRLGRPEPFDVHLAQGIAATSRARPPPADGAQGRVGGPWGYEGRNLHFGVREHAMGAAVNGMALHGGFIPYGSTFLDLLRLHAPGGPALGADRSSDRSGCSRTTAIGVGEDGPTHQPVEHYMALRAIPDLLFIRPGDANETVWAWRVAIESRHRPTGARPHAPERPDARSRASLRRPRAFAAAPTCSIAAVDEPGPHADRHRLRGAAHRRRREDAGRQEACARGSSRCRAGGSSRSSPPRIAMPCSAARSAARLAVEPGVSLGWQRWVGAHGGRSIGSTASARRHRRRGS